MRPTDPLPVVIFDLDGTILRSNSFPLWVLFLMIGKLFGLGLRRRGSLSLHAMRFLLWRKIGRLNHDELQRRLQLAWEMAITGCSPPPMNRFEATLLRRVRPSLRSLLNLMVEQRFDALLATAAAADYAEPFGRRLGFRHVLATRRGRIAGEPANVGPTKCQAVTDFLCEHGWYDRPRILFTDHIDDAPLMRDSNAVCWFGAADMLTIARDMAGEARIIHCRHLNDEALHATFVALCDYLAASDGSCRTCSLSEITVS